MAMFTAEVKFYHTESIYFLSARQVKTEDNLDPVKLKLPA